MITIIQIIQFFDILKNEKDITLNNLYGSEKQTDKEQYDFQN
jgi:hypothetical protein